MTLLWDCLAAFATATLSGMGVGGGSFLMIYLILYRHFPTVQAQGVNLLCFLCASAASLLSAAPEDNFRLSRATVTGMLGVGLCGALAGSRLSAGLPTHVFQQIFGGFLCVSGMYALFNSWRQRPQSPH